MVGKGSFHPTVVTCTCVYPPSIASLLLTQVIVSGEVSTVAIHVAKTEKNMITKVCRAAKYV